MSLFHSTLSQKVTSFTRPTLDGWLLTHARKVKAKWQTEKQGKLLFPRLRLQDCYDGELVLAQKLEKGVFFVSMKLLVTGIGLDLS